MGLAPKKRSPREQRTFRDWLARLDTFNLSVLWATLCLLTQDEDLTDLAGLPALLDDLAENACPEEIDE